MSSEPLLDIIPIMRREQDGQIVTQFDYPACESLGLIKMDFLGLRNLTIIDDALDNIEANRGERLVLEDLGLDDQPAYDLLARGDTLGVFQLDGGPMRSLLRLMKPDNFEDISALIALYRPGPMGANSHTNYALRKNGLQPITPLHPALAGPLDEILSTTYGLIVYQEQVMAVAQRVAGYTLGQADLLRRASTPPVPGSAPKNEPIIEPRNIGNQNRRMSSRVGIIDRMVIERRSSSPCRATTAPCRAGSRAQRPASSPRRL